MESVFYNRTRQAPSIPRKLIKEGRPYLLPLYYLLLTSELAAEGIRNSGSYRFADHVYAGKPAGRFGVGWLLDAIMLRMPSARSFRARYQYSKAEVHRLVRERFGDSSRLDILAVPAGLARELFEAAGELRREDAAGYDRVRWHGIDLDPDLVGRLRSMAAAQGYPMEFHCGDALDPAAYQQTYDMVISLGLAEFVPDDKLLSFYRLVRGRLKPGGRFVTSGLRPHRLSDYLLRNIGDLHTFYRSSEQLRELAQQAGFSSGRTYKDATGLLSMLVCER